MTDSEVTNRLEYLKNKAELALSTTKSNCSWAKDDVKGTITALDTAIKALEKQEKINNILNSNCLSALDGKCHYDGECMLHRYLEILKIIRSDEE